DIIFTREPGGIAIAEQIRTILLDPKNTSMDARSEALLYAAARRQHLVEKVLPALQANKIVLCDRFIDSSLAYQGVARGLGIEEVYAINQFAIENHMPDATIYLKVDVETGLSRVASRGEKDRLDKEGEKFHRLVAQGYEEVLTRFPKRIHSIDATQDVESVFADTYALIKELIK
ncbi:MAG: dTMP kinase, partial [Erysipelotrichia bacterium]|nr:dTMP kinase [Erysipelotrichia bacterium]